MSGVLYRFVEMTTKQTVTNVGNNQELGQRVRESPKEVDLKPFGVKLQWTQMHVGLGSGQHYAICYKLPQGRGHPYIYCSVTTPSFAIQDTR